MNNIVSSEIGFKPGDLFLVDGEFCILILVPSTDHYVLVRLSDGANWVIGDYWEDTSPFIEIKKFIDEFAFANRKTIKYLGNSTIRIETNNTSSEGV